MNLFYRKMGCGPPLIILHGLFGMSDNWLPIGRRLAKHYTVYLPDQRNHGRSPKSDLFNYDVLLDDLIQFYHTHGLQRAILMGHSMGGKAAMRFALNFPALVEKLVVIDIAPKTYKHSHFKIFIEGLNALKPEGMAARREADDQLARYIPDDSVRAFLLKNLERDAHKKFRWRINLQAITYNLHSIMAGLNETRRAQLPALFLCGGLSDYVKREDHGLIKSFFPEALIETIPQVTHWLHAENPEALCAHLNRFIK